MDTLFIFGAKYLFLISLIVIAVIFYQAKPEERWQMLKYGAIILPLTYLLGLLARELYYDPRPFVLGGFNPLIDHLPDNGFPSDHTLLTSSLAMITYFFHKKSSFWLWIMAVAVGASRVYVGVHHSIDILGSIVLALVSGYLAHVIISKLWNKHTNHIDTLFR